MLLVATVQYIAIFVKDVMSDLVIFAGIDPVLIQDRRLDWCDLKLKVLLVSTLLVPPKNTAQPMTTENPLLTYTEKKSLFGEQDVYSWPRRHPS